MNQPTIPRYSSRPFPPYTYVPGSGTPHPVNDPRGHMHAAEPEQPLPLDTKDWPTNETYLYAVDLFNHGYYWEAHEAWEALWHAAGRQGDIANFLKGLIKLAAAGVKEREGNVAGVKRHLSRAAELLKSIAQQDFCGVSTAALTANTSQAILPPRLSLTM